MKYPVWKNKFPIRAAAALLAGLLIFPLSACQKKSDSDTEITLVIDLETLDENKIKSQNGAETLKENIGLTDNGIPYYKAKEIELYTPAEDEIMEMKVWTSNHDTAVTVIHVYNELFWKEQAEQYSQGNTGKGDNQVAIESSSAPAPIDSQNDSSNAQSDTASGENSAVINRHHIIFLDQQGNKKQEIILGDMIQDSFAHIHAAKLTESGELILVIKPYPADGANDLWIYRISQTGDLHTEKQILSIDKKDAQSEEYHNTFIDHDGYIYVQGIRYGEREEIGVIKVFSPEYEELFELQEDLPGEDLWYFDSGIFSDGDNLYITRRSNIDYISREVLIIDKERKSFGEPVEMKEINSFDTLYSGNGKIYASDGKTLAAVDMKSGEMSQIMTWNNLDIYLGEGGAQIYMIGDNHIVLEKYDYDRKDPASYPKPKYHLLEETANPNTGKKVLRIGGYGITYEQIMREVFNFNQGNHASYIEIVDYSNNYGGDDVDPDDLKRMNLDFMSGNAPDILYGNEGDFDTFASSGVLTDLNILMDADPDFNRSDFYENILNAGMRDGKLYQISQSFSLLGLAGSRSLMGDRTGWTIGEFDAFANDLPANVRSFVNVSQEDLLTYVFQTEGDFLLDKIGSAETELALIEMLEFAWMYGDPEAEIQARYAAGVFENEYELVRNGELAMFTYRMANSYEYLSLMTTFGEDVVFTGYPSTHSEILCEPGALFAISEASQYKEEAWEFVSHFFTKDMQDQMAEQYVFPLRISSLEESLERDIARDKNVSQNNDYAALMTETSAGRIRDIISQTNRMALIEDTVLSIVQTEAQTFFSGQKTSAEAVSVIEQRLQTYVNERR